MIINYIQRKSVCDLVILMTVAKKKKRKRASVDNCVLWGPGGEDACHIFVIFQ